MKGEKEGEGVPSVVLTRSPTAPGHVPGLWHRRTYQAAIGTRVPRVLTECFVQLQGSRIVSSGTANTRDCRGVPLRSD